MDSREPHLFFGTRMDICLVYQTVAASPQGGKWLATGSEDEIIRAWELRRRKEVGGLMENELEHHETLRLDHSSYLPITLAPRLYIRRWNALCISCA